MKNRKVMDINKSRMVIDVQDDPDMVVVAVKTITRQDGYDDYKQELNFIQNKMFETTRTRFYSLSLFLTSYMNS